MSTSDLSILTKVAERLQSYLNDARNGNIPVVELRGLEELHDEFQATGVPLEIGQSQVYFKSRNERKHI